MSFCYRCGAPMNVCCPKGDNRQRECCSSCDYIHYENPKNQVAVVLSHKGRILWMKRACEPRKGFWEIPGGYVEQGESLRQAAAREAMEETGVAVQAEQLSLYLVGSIEAVNEIHAIFRAEVESDFLSAGAEALAVAWFTEAEAPWADMAFDQSGPGFRLFYKELASGDFGMYYAEQALDGLHLRNVVGGDIDQRGVD